MSVLKNPASDLATYLAGKTVGGVALVQATNLFVGKMRGNDTTPSPSVWLLNTGGPPPEPYLGGSRQGFYRAQVQILVRGPAGDMQTGEQIARDVFELVAQLQLTGYVSTFAQSAQPIWLLEDNAQHDVWVTNVECQYVAALG